MSNEYITQIEVEINGTVVSDWKSFTAKKIDLGKIVELAGKSGWAGQTPRYAFDMEYVVPALGEFDFSVMLASPGLVTLWYKSGKKVSYRNVRPISKGDEKYDGKDEVTIVWEFCAESRDPAL